MTKVLVNFIQDRSGSMSSVWNETVNGFEQFVKSLKEGQEKDGIDYLFSLTVFDTQIDTPIVAQPIDVDQFVKTFETYGPRGSTALYDATGKTIKAVEDNSHGAEKIIIVICTDGHENSSREWKKDDLHASIDAKLNAGNWTFTYLGTQPETWDDAMSLGVSAGSTSTYVGANTTAAYTVTASAIRGMSMSPQRNSRSIIQDFSEKSVRLAANMKTKQDDDDDKKAGVGNVNIPANSIPQKPRVPVKPRKTDNSRRWK